MPSLDGLKPDKTGYLASLSMENPEGVFGSDPFGTGLMPDYAARFSGLILADTQGEYRFTLTSHAGSRLIIDGQAIVNVPISSGYGSGSGTATLDAGWHAIEVDHFEGAGTPELRLEWQGPGQARQTVDPQHLTPGKPWKAHTDAQGQFTVADFPAFLAPLEFRAECAGQCSIQMEQTQ
jgi:hypothetical protein